MAVENAIEKSAFQTFFCFLQSIFGLSDRLGWSEEKLTMRKIRSQTQTKGQKKNGIHQRDYENERTNYDIPFTKLICFRFN